MFKTGIHINLIRSMDTKTELTASSNGGADNARQETNISVSTNPMPTVGGVKTTTGMSTTVEDSTHDKQTTTAFVDSNESIKRDIISDHDATFKQSNYIDSDLANYFARPLYIDTYSWDLGVPFSSVEIDPWTTWLEHSSIIKKITNFQLIRMNLHVRIVINSSPFLYGRMMATYAPLYGNKGAIDITSGALNNTQRKMILSQHPKVFIDPTSAATTEMTIPYFFPTNYLNITKRTLDYSKMGSLRLFELNELRAASSTASSVVDISVYIWATDVELRIPTVDEADSPATFAQAGDEYAKDGFVSSTASAVASAAGELRDVPVIGAFARATEVGANIVGGIASIFGFSRPTSVVDLRPYKPNAVASIANTIGVDTATKLTFDPKQETTVASDVAGLDNMDHMTFANICGRESFIGSGTWTSADGFGHMIHWNFVTPTHALTNNVTGGVALAMSPTAFATMPFKWWSGTLIYRVQIVASKYHRGRIRISYEPYGGALDATVNNLTYNHILDLDEARDYEFSVSWAQATPYKQLEDVRTITAGEGGLGAYQYDKYNGTIYISVVNNLSSPLSTADVDINLYVRAGPDFEFQGTKNAADGVLTPYNTVADLTAVPTLQAPPKDDGEEYTIAQAGEDKVAVDIPTVELVGRPDISTLEQKSSVFYGERFVSLRNILKRYDRLEAVTTPSFNDNNGRLRTLEWWRPMYPAAGGVNPGGIYQYGAQTFNPYKTPLVVYYGSAFAGYRGSMRYKFIAINKFSSSSIVEFSRYSGPTKPGVTATTYTETVIPANMYAIPNAILDSIPGFEGGYVNHSTVNNGHEIELPWYSDVRFFFNEMYHADKTGYGWATNYMNYHGRIIVGGDSISANCLTGYQTYVATGEDFNLLWFINAPTCYVPSVL